MMKNVLLAVLVFCSCFLALSMSAHAKAPVNVEILYMNHGPMEPTLRDLRELFAGFQDKVSAHWYDVDQAAGKAFMEDKKIQGHVPLLILVNGEKQFKSSGREVILQGFPTGAGPFSSVEGNWSVADLRLILNELTR
jgi:hypothetical protein